MKRWVPIWLLVTAVAVAPVTYRLIRNDNEPARDSQSVLNPAHSAVEAPRLANAASERPSERKHAEADTQSGPAPMTAANADRVHRFAEEMAADSKFPLAEPWTRINSEPVDHGWADPIELQLADRIRALGRTQTALQLSEPRCFTSVCVILGNGGLSTEQPNADWQRLLYQVADEPWFQAHFIDLSTSMRAEEKGTMYVTYLLRRGYTW